MFKLVPSDRPGFTSAQINEDNLIISWDSSLSEPPWDSLYMERYHQDFMDALRDFRVLQKFKRGLGT